jgi:hypothetical protein
MRYVATTFLRHDIDLVIRAQVPNGEGHSFASNLQMA